MQSIYMQKALNHHLECC
uniref:Uncharacterized protein n=1 Tax=Rhizophora mucronata TaxID=61149 RepID=A0A2P2QHD7_RHIMU